MRVYQAIINVKEKVDDDGDILIWFATEGTVVVHNTEILIQKIKVRPNSAGIDFTIKGGE